MARNGLQGLYFLKFSISNNHLEDDFQKRILLDYPLIEYQLFITGVMVFISLMVISFFIFKKFNKIIYDFLIYFSIVFLVWYFTIAKFMSVSFYGVIPMYLLNDLKKYLLFNGLCYVMLATILFVIIRIRLRRTHYTDN